MVGTGRAVCPLSSSSTCLEQLIVLWGDEGELLLEG